MSNRPCEMRYNTDAAIKFIARYAAFSSNDSTHDNYTRILLDLEPLKVARSSTVRGLVDTILDNAQLSDNKKDLVGIWYGLFNGKPLGGKLDGPYRTAVSKLDAWAMNERIRAA